jgi:uncharacterized protein YndB with AHSA1/START domain
MPATIGIGLLVLVAVLLVAIATRPAAFRFQRSAAIAAPAGLVFAHIADFHQWKDWVTYDRVDPKMVRTFEGPPSGVGAAYHFAGPKIGEGRMTFAAIEPDRRVEVTAQFIKPFSATNRIEFTVQPAPSGSVVVTWAISGRNTFVTRAFSVFVNMDKMMGRDFETGLADLKRISEAEAQHGAAQAPSDGPTGAVAAL